jgi:FkbM family methyltransferase
MPSVGDLAKRVALNTLPDAILRPLRRRYYARMLRLGTALPEVDMPLVQRFVQPGDCVADIGAAIGVYSKLLSERVGPEGLVYGVEPVPSTYDVFCSNVRRLGLTNVQPLACAISDKDGWVAMEVPLRASGWEDMYRAQIVEGHGVAERRQVRVASRTVDSLWADSSRPIAFIKCDVEGHELACVRGAKRVVARWAPAWLLEINDDPDVAGSAARATCEELAAMGYGTFIYDGERLRRRATGEISLNYWFLTPAHLDRLRGEPSVAALGAA